MTLIALYALVLALPLFFGSWRLALLGIGAQPALVFLLVAAGAGPTQAPTHGAVHGADPHGWVALVVLGLDLLVVRALLGPWLLWRAVRHGAGRQPGQPDDEFELFPGDLLHIVLAAALVVASVKFAWRLYPTDLGAAAHMACAAAEVLLGFFVVTQQRRVLGQALGMLTIENGAVLLEALPGHHWELPVHAALTAVFVGLVLTVARFLRRDAQVSAPPGADEEAAVGEFEAL